VVLFPYKFCLDEIALIRPTRRDGAKAIAASKKEVKTDTVRQMATLLSFVSQVQDLLNKSSSV
jgi:hypothetical protein